MAVEEEENARQQLARQGSILGHSIIYRDRKEGHNRLWNDYFAAKPVYPDHLFRRRFRMSRNLFLRIQSTIEAHDNYFIQKRDACGVLGLSSLQKITAAMRMLAYGASANLVDDYVRIGESTAESLKRFVSAVIAVFGDEYKRAPNKEDINRLLGVGERRGFPDMLESIDCMHWKRKNCPTSWQGMYTRHIHEPTIILEALASYDLWIWHSFFGLPGALNDINVLDRSPVFRELLAGRAPPATYSINGHEYKMGYYLADGIYPIWATFVKTIPCPRGKKQVHFAAAQESAGKDVERASGVLQSRWAIVRGPSRFGDQETLVDIMEACVIMHNMIIEDERGMENVDYDAIDSCLEIIVSHEQTPNVMEFLQTHIQMRNKQVHSQLQADLVEHLWQKYGE